MRKSVAHLFHYTIENTGTGGIGDDCFDIISFVGKATAEAGSGKISGNEEDTHKLWSGLSGLRNSQTQKEGADSKFTPQKKAYHSPGRSAIKKARPNGRAPRCLLLTFEKC